MKYSWINVFPVHLYFLKRRPCCFIQDFKSCHARIFLLRVFYGIAQLLPIAPPYFRILLINYFRTRPREKVILATPRVANWKIRFHSDVKLNYQVKYLKYVVIALILHWHSIHIAAINFHLTKFGNLIQHQEKRTQWCACCLWKIC